MHYFSLLFRDGLICIFTSYKCMVAKVLFLGQIFEIDILIDLHVLRSLESKNQIFIGWSVCLTTCYHHYWKNRVQQKLQVWFSSLLKYANNTWNFSWSSERILCILQHMKQYITAYDQNFLLVHLSIFKLH